MTGEAHIGLTRFFKSNKANAPPMAAAKAIVAQPKALGLSRRTVLKNVSSSAAPDTFSQSSTQGRRDAESDLSAATAIGVGQSYVNPELFRQPAASTNAPPTGTYAT